VSADPFNAFGFRQKPDGTLEPLKYEHPKRKCPRCGEHAARWHEAHADTGMDEMVLRCDACGKDTPQDECR